MKYRLRRPLTLSLGLFLVLFLLTLWLPAQAMAQHDGHKGHQGHEGHSMSSAAMGGTSGALGEAAFAAITEVVAMLEADPNTDWSAVDIDALHSHLMDMRLVMSETQVETQELPQGASFRVSAEGEALAAVKRMVPAHAAMLPRDRPSWKISTTLQDDSVTLVLEGASEKDVAQIRGLGFYGIMVLGSHHGPHHRMIALGHMLH